MGKVKKEKQQSADETQDIAEVTIKEEDTYEDKLKNCSVIAQPMASKKLTKKCLKLIKKGMSGHSLRNFLNFFLFAYEAQCICSPILASKQKTFLRNGLKDVQSRLKKGETGYVPYWIFARD